MPTRILLFVDELLVQEDLIEALELQGYQVIPGVDTDEAVLAQARECHPDLVIIAVLFSGIDGIAVSEILSREQLAPVVLLTEDFTLAQLARAQAAGVMACLLRPWGVDRLRPIIEIAMARYAELHALHAKVQTLDAQLTTLKAQERTHGQEQQRARAETENAFRRPSPPLLPGLTAAESLLYWFWQRYIDDNPPPPS